MMKSAVGIRGLATENFLELNNEFDRGSVRIVILVLEVHQVDKAQARAHEAGRSPERHFAAFISLAWQA